MVSERREHGGPPAPVTASWRRIEAWLAEHLPQTGATLRPGVSDGDLAAFEQALGRPLPDDVRESWKIHDGQGWPAAPDEPEPDPDDDEDEDDEDEDDDEDIHDPLMTGVIYGMKLLTIVDMSDSLSDRSALGIWTYLAEAADEGADREDPSATSFPPGAVRLCYGSRGWVPLHWDGNRNHLGIDLDPGPNGVVGQVINFGGDESGKFVLAPSWAQFLEDLADELEAGNFVIDPEHGYGSFLLKCPRIGPLYTQYEAWSRAKLAPEFRRRR
jgi:cell wall assembly regulator SMI1